MYMQVFIVQFFIITIVFSIKLDGSKFRLFYMLVTFVQHYMPIRVDYCMLRYVALDHVYYIILHKSNIRYQLQI